jgi:hypothetical protein
VKTTIDHEGEGLSVFARRGPSRKFLKEMEPKKVLPVIREDRENPATVSGE